MTALIAMLGGVRATVFAALAVSLLGWGSVQTWRLDRASGQNATLSAQLAEVTSRVAGFADAMNQVNTQADAEIAEAEKRAETAELSGKLAAQAQAKAEKQAASFAQQLTQAKRKPACKSLLETDLTATCGVTLQ